MAKKPVVDQDTLLSVLKKQGVELFHQRSGLPLNQAQRNLEGRTEYVNDSSLKAFVATIHSVYVLNEGLVLGFVESVQKGPSKESGRVYRPVFFDIFGNIIYRTELEDSYETLSKAQVEFFNKAEDIDAVASTLEGIEKKYDVLEKQLKDWKKFMDTLA
jgi:hypothetical protein